MNFSVLLRGEVYNMLQGGLIFLTVYYILYSLGNEYDIINDDVTLSRVFF